MMSPFNDSQHSIKSKVTISFESSDDLISSIYEALIIEVNSLQKSSNSSINIVSNSILLEFSSLSLSDTRAWPSSFLRLLQSSYEVSLLAKKNFSHKA